jgi:predicted ATPase
MRPWAIRSELDADGVELASVVKGIEQSKDDVARTERLWKMVAEAFQLPVARPLRVQDFGTTTNLQLELIRPGAAVPLADLSDGSIQMLRLACWASGQSRILIDEPELHLHPAWARLAARWILQSRAQFVLATHSPELLDGLTPGLADGTVRLVVLGVDGTVKQPSADLLAKRMENGWELGDLFRGGEPDLGGWPW